ncbi:probable leucine-rich repeat receptor-like serine/threonine-protein kinase At3g14840 [Capsella rubella]|uniref:probable leucine-rich repeat receptor-like serine/threonine-protein kinase At3g14840 n=1 Tax=Capsella rubella TaxID=81985 RepID=UPI000CD57BA9|nr:probable leucine-rich repeat receptor-like serine/threonine-protein kinase At3g14840 [Capsella rubella]
MVSQTRSLVWFLFICLIVSTFIGFAQSATLPTQEVEALRIIGNTLKKTTWNFNVNPCDVASNVGGWRNPNPVEGSEDAVTCDCSFLNGTVCHVTSILLKTQNLQGSLPKEFVGLPYLQEINLARNYLNGSIPPEWGALPLVNLTLLGNRLSGPIPKEIGNITTLTRLVLEYNQLSGILPPELGNLSNLQRLFLSSNNFSGDIPITFGKLTNLTDFRISDNSLTGSIPDFIGDWTELESLVSHGSGLSGPIPVSIAGLTKLEELRISDLTGPGSPVPLLHDISKMKTLILRNCNLTGELPSFLGTNATLLENLDLSFNQLSGPIPSTYTELRDVKNFYLTGNMLNGSVPNWMVKEKDRDTIDLSYNNFSEDTNTQECFFERMNLFASSSSVTNNSLNVYCLKSYQCAKSFYGLHINCGGDEVIINGTKFNADTYDRAPHVFESTINAWVSSNTGNFIDDHRVPEGSGTIWNNTSELKMIDPQLYAQARLSAVSLTYYAMCIVNGDYNVNLHFAEFMFKDDQTFKSLGRRIFDIYIQGKLMVKDFNIVEEAGGVGKAVIKTIPVTITDGKLEIRLYWAGKGTVAIPDKGVYGPLISAISVDPAKAL